MKDIGEGRFLVKSHGEDQRAALPLGVLHFKEYDHLSGFYIFDTWFTFEN